MNRHCLVSTRSFSAPPLAFLLPFAITAAYFENDSKRLTACDPRSTPEDLRDAVMARYTSSCSARDVPKRFNGVQTRQVSTVLSEVNEMIKKAKKDHHKLAPQMELEKSSGHCESKFVYRWVSERCDATILQGKGHTESELKAGAFAILSGEIEAKQAFALYGFSDTTFRHFVRPVCKVYSCQNVTQLKKAVKESSVVKDSLRKTIYDQSKPKQGRPTHLTQDEEAVIIGSNEIKAQFGRGKNRRHVSKDLNDAVQALMPNRNVKPDSARKYGRRALQRVLEREPGRKGGKKSRTGVVKASKLSKRRAKQSDPRLQWMMTHRIVEMYRLAKRQQIAFQKGELDEFETSIAITPTPKKKRSVETSLMGPPTKRAATASSAESTTAMTSSNSSSSISFNDAKSPTFEQGERLYEHNGKFYHVPDDLDDVHPRADQVWNGDEIGFDPDGAWDGVVCTFKWCMAGKLWMAKSGEKAPFWVSMLYFVRADGMCHLVLFLPRYALTKHSFPSWSKKRRK